jgi:hypothetical protein
MYQMLNLDRTNSIVLLTLFLLGGFGFVLLSSTSLDYICLFLLVLLALPVLRNGEGKKVEYSLAIKLYLAFVFLSCLYSWRINGQSIQSVLGHSYEFFSLGFFFVLVRYQLSYAEAEAAFVKVSLLFCFCYFLQWAIYPTVLFSGALDENNVDVDRFRLRLPGSLCCYFLLMFSLNRFLIHRLPKDLLLVFVAFFPIIIQGFRSLLTFTLFAFFMIIPFVQKSFKKSIKYVFIGFSFVAIAMATSLVQSKMGEMMERQESNQTFENDDYIRFLSFNYYWNEQFTKPYEKFFGGGKPVDVSTEYYNDIDIAEENFGFFWVDLGIVGLSMIIGIPAVLLLVFMYIRCMWRCREPEIQFIRFTLFVVLCSSLFTTMELFRTGNILLLSFLLYLEYSYHQEMQSEDSCSLDDGNLEKLSEQTESVALPQ